MRLVLDTNILISATLKPDGLEAWLVNAVLAGQFEAWVTPEVWAEYDEVLARPKFAARREASRRLLDALATHVRHTAARTTATAAIDEDDNRFLECAEAAEAEFLVTGNLRHYPEVFGNTRTLNARGLHDYLLQTGEAHR